MGCQPCCREGARVFQHSLPIQVKNQPNKNQDTGYALGKPLESCVVASLSRELLQLETGTNEGPGGSRQMGCWAGMVVRALLASKQGSSLQQVLAAHSSPPRQQLG